MQLMSTFNKGIRFGVRKIPPWSIPPLGEFPPGSGLGFGLGLRQGEFDQREFTGEGIDLGEISQYLRFLLCVIDIFSKYGWVIPSKDKKGITIITNVFQNILDESNRREAKSEGRKPNKLSVNKGSEFCNISMKSWLEKTTQKCVHPMMSENLLLLKDLLEH